MRTQPCARNDDKAWKGIYVGCSPDSSAWLIFNPSTGKIIASKSVVLDAENAMKGNYLTLSQMPPYLPTR
jgi:hypothetical protein